MLKRSWYRGLEWLAVVALILAAGVQAPAQESDANVEELVPPGGAATSELEALDAPNIDFDLPDVDPRLERAAQPTEAASEFWLGVVLREVSPLIRAQLGLPEGQGMIIDGVQPESPAAKAGIKKYDILLKAGDRPLVSREELQKLVEGSEGKEVVFEILRGGKKKLVSVTPTKRPAQQTPAAGEPGGLRGFSGIAAGEGGIRRWQKWIDEIERRPFRFRRVGPGILVGPDIEVNTLPDGVSVKIERRGKEEPAKVIVTQGDKKWEATEKDLTRIPGAIRAFVQDVLDRVGPVAVDVHVENDAANAASGVRLRRFTVGRDGEGLDQRLENLERLVQQLRGVVQGEHPEKTPPAEEIPPADPEAKSDL